MSFVEEMASQMMNEKSASITLGFRCFFINYISVKHEKKKSEIQNSDHFDEVGQNGERK
jgi:hypothetical protein